MFESHIRASPAMRWITTQLAMSGATTMRREFSTAGALLRQRDHLMPTAAVQTSRPRPIDEHAGRQ